MKAEIIEPLVLLRHDVEPEVWKVISAFFSIPKDANKIVITFTNVEYFTEE